ncbi:peptide deformylase [Desulfobaculum senezii]
MKREIVTYPEPVLAEKAAEITEITPEIRALAEDMAETMYEGDGIGLAAPQVGESCRLVVVDITGPNDRSDLRILVNPCITSREGEVESEEGCLSVIGLRGKVTRAENITVDATDLEGNPVHIEADGLLAICLQHEIDHLDGVLFIDHLSRLKRSLYDKKVKKWVRQKKRHSA